MKLNGGIETKSYVREVSTPVGIFTIHFPCGVFNPRDNLNRIPEVVANFNFEEASRFASDEKIKYVSDKNARRLQEALNKAICFGTSVPQGRIELLYGVRSISVC